MAIKSQSIGEYIILISVLALVLVGMQTYLKRGIQAVVGVQADNLGRGGQAYFKLDPQRGFLLNMTQNTTRISSQNITENKKNYIFETSTSQNSKANSLYLQGVINEE